MTDDQLNAAANLLNTTDKNLVISVCIKTLVNAGMPIKSAFDKVLGVGSYDKLAGDIWDAINA
jgi:hypothetical protein